MSNGPAKKTVIIINGNGGAGKDTLCGFAAEIYRTVNVSSAEPVKEIARRYGGWNGEKDEKSRKFLADLKQLFTEYNDLSCQYLAGEYNKFLKGDAEILFVHIREGKEIDKFKKLVEIPCITLLIRREKVRQQWGNESDDNVERYVYDYSYDNDKELTEAKLDFQQFLKEIIKKSREA